VPNATVSTEPNPPSLNQFVPHKPAFLQQYLVHGVINPSPELIFTIGGIRDTNSGHVTFNGTRYTFWGKQPVLSGVLLVGKRRRGFGRPRGFGINGELNFRQRPRGAAPLKTSMLMLLGQQQWLL